MVYLVLYSPIPLSRDGLSSTLYSPIPLSRDGLSSTLYSPIPLYLEMVYLVPYTPIPLSRDGSDIRMNIYCSIKYGRKPICNLLFSGKNCLYRQETEGMACRALRWKM